MDKTQQPCEVCCVQKKAAGVAPHTCLRVPTTRTGPQGGSPYCLRHPVQISLHARDHKTTTQPFTHHTRHPYGLGKTPRPFPPDTAQHPCRQGTWQCSRQTRRTAVANAVLVCVRAQPCTAYRPDDCSAAPTPDSPPSCGPAQHTRVRSSRVASGAGQPHPSPYPKPLPTSPDKVQLWTPPCRDQPTDQTRHTTTTEPPPRLAAQGNVNAQHTLCSTNN